MSHPLSSTKFVPRSVLRGLRGVLAVLAVTLATHAFGIAAPSHQTPAAPNLLSAPSAVDIQSCATEDIQLDVEVLPRDELQAHDESQTPQAFQSPTTKKQAYLEAKSASSPIYTGASSYEIKSAQRYEKVTDIASSFKEQTLLHTTLSNGQTIQATAGHPFKTQEGWRDAVLLMKGGQLLLGGGDAGNESYTTITDVREGINTTAVFNLEVANLHTFFVGVDGVAVHNGAREPVPPSGFNKTSDISHGQPVYKKGQTFITPYIGSDGNSHNGAVWKKCTGSPKNFRKATRDGTYAADLTVRIGN